MAPIRIRYQSYVDYENGATYWDNLRAHLAEIVDGGTKVEVIGITPFNSYAPVSYTHLTLPTKA